MTLMALMDLDWLKSEIRRYLEEDIGSGDVTTARVVPKDAVTRGWLVARKDCVVAGIELARLVFSELDANIGFITVIPDGGFALADSRIACIEGTAAPMLTGERTALNLLQRLSGIATLTRRYVEAVAGTGAQILDTRKTTPGLRQLEKYAVRAGGGWNHRAGLYDAVLIKDNHIAIAGSAQEALRRAKLGSGIPIQIEVDNLDQLRTVLELGVDAVLLDNMAPHQVAEAMRMIRSHPLGQACRTEASGGIALQNVRAYAEAGVDCISIGALTHSAPAADIALDFELSYGG
jgi:nicotinate-nucleotide pyrophosphorylase (carboxylating)